MENAVKKIALALATTAILGFAAPAFAAESDSATKVAASQSGGAGGSAGLLGGGARPKPKPHHKSVHHGKQ
jgi:hypothetical protein